MFCACSKEGTELMYPLFHYQIEYPLFHGVLTSTHKYEQESSRSSEKYEDEDHDKVLLASDSDLAPAINHATSANWKGLRLYILFKFKRKKNHNVKNSGLL